MFNPPFMAPALDLSPLLTDAADTILGPTQIVPNAFAKGLVARCVAQAQAQAKKQANPQGPSPLIVDFGGALTEALLSQKISQCAKRFVHIGPQTGPHVIPLGPLHPSRHVTLERIGEEAARTLASTQPGVLDYDDLERLGRMCAALAACEILPFLTLLVWTRRPDEGRTLHRYATHPESYPKDHPLWSVFEAPIYPDFAARIEKLCAPILASPRWRAFASPSRDGDPPVDVETLAERLFAGELVLLADLQTDFEVAPARARFVAETLVRRLALRPNFRDRFEVIVSFATRNEVHPSRLKMASRLRRKLSKWCAARYGQKAFFADVALAPLLRTYINRSDA